MPQRTEIVHQASRTQRIRSHDGSVLVRALVQRYAEKGKMSHRTPCWILAQNMRILRYSQAIKMRYLCI